MYVSLRVSFFYIIEHVLFMYTQCSYCTIIRMTITSNFLFRVQTRCAGQTAPPSILHFYFIIIDAKQSLIIYLFSFHLFSLLLSSSSSSHHRQIKAIIIRHSPPSCLFQKSLLYPNKTNDIIIPDRIDRNTIKDNDADRNASTTNY